MTQDVIQQLQQDHSNFEVLMRILEEELDRLAESGLPEFDLIHEIMRYMIRYGDRFHHPLEDLVFARLRKKDASVIGTLDQLEKEHEALADKGRMVLYILEGGSDAETLTWHDIDDRCREYIDDLLTHKDEEEEVVFPLARVSLEEADWKAIRKQIEWQEDPVFGAALEQGYRTLYEHITRGRD